MHIRPRLEEGWSTLILLWAMMFITAFAIQQADLINGLHIIPLVGTAAILTGTLLAKAAFLPTVPISLPFAYGRIHSDLFWSVPPTALRAWPGATGLFTRMMA
ncbi:MAG: hypothetical protein HC804_03605 [Anaerolineae bacterium]|nr:hypothetical protein [Anaerolineae bacterium]